MKSALATLLADIDILKRQLDAARPLPVHTLASLRDKLALEWTYHSNAIEGSTLTLRETKFVLEGITVDGKTRREHLEACNHRDAIVFVEVLVTSNDPLSEWHVKNIHALVLKGIDRNEAGTYRRENVLISRPFTTPSDHLHLAQAMADLIDWYTSTTLLAPVIRAAQLHARFIKICPFTDGNGSTARLLMNLELMRAAYPPAVIQKNERLSYHNGLDEACTTRNFDAISTLVAQAVKRSLETYLSLIIRPSSAVSHPRLKG